MIYPVKNEYTMQDFLKAFDLYSTADYMIVWTSLSGGTPDITIYDHSKFTKKLEFYQSQLDDELRWKVHQNIQIVGFAFVDSLVEYFKYFEEGSECC